MGSGLYGGLGGGLDDGLYVALVVARAPEEAKFSPNNKAL